VKLTGLDFLAIAAVVVVWQVVLTLVIRWRLRRMEDHLEKRLDAAAATVGHRLDQGATRR
jgi:hypothetical protein